MDLLYPLKTLLDLIAPPRCAACGVAIVAGEGLRIAFCPRCAESCLEATHPAPGGARAVLLYGGAASEAVHRVKYRRDDGAATRLGLLLGRLAPRELSRCEVVCPVPLGAARLRERGFDQAALLAWEVARALRLPFAPLLTRRRETSALSRLSRGDRRGAIRGAFSASPRAKGRRVLLVDDVYTTGATTGEASGALLEAGAEAVEILCLAMTPLYSDKASHEPPNQGGTETGSGTRGGGFGLVSRGF